MKSLSKERKLFWSPLNKSSIVNHITNLPRRLRSTLDLSVTDRNIADRLYHQFISASSRDKQSRNVDIIDIVHGGRMENWVKVKRRLT